jgi:hypothetical protein
MMPIKHTIDPKTIGNTNANTDAYTGTWQRSTILISTRRTPKEYKQILETI